MSSRWVAVWGTSVVAGACAAQDAATAPPRTVELTAVVATGDVLPRAGTVRRVTGLDVNDRCFLALRAEAWAPGTDNIREVILAGPHRGPLATAAIAGEALPGDPRYGLSMVGFTSVQIGGSGELSYGATLIRGGAQAPGLVKTPFFSAGHTVFARRGEPAPGLAPGVNWAGILEQQQGDTAFLACLATVAGPGISAANDQVLLSGGGSTPDLVQEGMPVASLGGATLGFLPTSTPTVRSSVAVWLGTITPPGRDALPAVVGLSPVQVLAQRGGGAPGLTGVQFQEFLPYPGISGQGFEVAFTAALMGEGVTEFNRWSVWTRSGALLARGDQPAPGLPEGVRYLAFSPPVLFGPGDAVMFTASLRGTEPGAGRTALFAGPRGEVRLVAQEGAAAPGAGEGVVLGSFLETGGGDPVFVNDAGTVVFRTRLSGPGVTGANDMALYAWDPEEGLALVAREGQVVAVRGTPRTIDNLGVNTPAGPGSLHTNGRDGRRTILNRHGECFFIATFQEQGQQALMKAQVSRPPCAADFNLDRFVDCFDYLDFVAAFEGGDPDADVTEDGFVDFFDYGLFVDRFEAGC